MTAMSPLACLPGEDRCRHQMLVIGGVSTCAWCKGLPDVADDVPEVELDDTPRIRWVHPEQKLQCSSCDEWVGLNGWCTWTAQGVLCRTCGEKEDAA